MISRAPCPVHTLWKIWELMKFCTCVRSFVRVFLGANRGHEVMVASLREDGLTPVHLLVVCDDCLDVQALARINVRLSMWNLP